MIFKDNSKFEHNTINYAYFHDDLFLFCKILLVFPFSHDN